MLVEVEVEVEEVMATMMELQIHLQHSVQQRHASPCNKYKSSICRPCVT